MIEFGKTAQADSGVGGAGLQQPLTTGTYCALSETKPLTEQEEKWMCNLSKKALLEKVTEKVTKARIDPRLCYPGISAGYGRGWVMAAVNCCHPGCCGIPVQEGNAAPAVCAHGWEAAGAVGELLVPHRMRAAAERMGAAQDVPRMFSLTCCCSFLADYCWG